MFYGAAIKPGATFELKSANDSEILHLSQACLNEPKDGGKTYLQLKNTDNNSYTLCALQKDSCEHASLDLFLHSNTGVKFTCKGKNEIHIVGYWEPKPESMDSDDEDGEGLEGLEGMDIAPDSLKSKGNASDNESLEALGNDDDDDDDDEDDDEDEDEDEDEDDEETEDEKPKGKSPFVDQKKAQQLQQKNAKNSGNQNNKNNKNKQNENKQNEGNAKRKHDSNSDQSNKKVKGGAAPAAESQKYKNDLIEYLKKHGKTPIGALGSKVKKPHSIAIKLGQFLKEDGSTFKIESGNVLLSKA